MVFVLSCVAAAAVVAVAAVLKDAVRQSRLRHHHDEADGSKRALLGLVALVAVDGIVATEEFHLTANPTGCVPSGE